MIIRSCKETDVERVIEVWYESTVKAHDFIPREKWLAHKNDLKYKYLPLAETWVADADGEVVGFISLLDNYIGALFVKPSHQGQLIGTQLIEHVLQTRDTLTVGVYKKNQKARRFYEKQGFVFVNEEMQEETGEVIQNMIRKTASQCSRERCSKILQFREGNSGDAQDISKLILRVFNKFVAPGFAPMGRTIFEDFVKPSEIIERLNSGKSFTLVATTNEKVVAIIEVRDGNHISLLFVDDSYHKAGIAKKLVSLAVKRIEQNEILVHSSPYAFEIYKKLGFEPLDKEQEVDGMRYIPMRKDLAPLR